MFHEGMVIHCKNGEQWNELLRMLEDFGYLWCTGNRAFTEGVPYDPAESSFICISDGSHTTWPINSFFKRGCDTIHEWDMEPYDTPIEFEDFLSPVSVDIDDFL